jgi:hypothetical protein
MNIDVPTEVRIVKKADDVGGDARVSVGGRPGNYYCVYRGSKESAIAALEAATRAMREMAGYLDAVTGEPGEPDIAPDGAKKYA